MCGNLRSDDNLDAIIRPQQTWRHRIDNNDHVGIEACRIADGKLNKHLVALLNKARSAQAALDDRSVSTLLELAARVHCHPKKFTRLAWLNYLAPDIVASIRDGTQPPELTCRTLMAAKIPMDWALQRRLLGFPDQPDFFRAAPGW